MNNVLIVSPIFPHYRKGLFNELINSVDVNYYFASGNGKDISIKNLADKNNERYHSLKNIWIGKYFVLQFGLFKIIKHIKPDAVIFTGDWKILSTWLYILYFRFTKIDTYFWSHGILEDRKTINNIVKLVFFSIFSSGGFLYSRRALDILKSWGYRKNLTVVYNSLNYSLQKRIEQEYVNEDPKPEPYLIFIGRITPERQLDLLIKAIKKLNNEKFKVLVIGSGDYLNSLKVEILKSGVEQQFKFVGSLYDESEIHKLFRYAKACVFPGSIGLSIVHSFTYGIPVITHDNMNEQKPECEALIDGVNGFFYKYNSASDLASKIRQIYELDEKTFERFSCSARKVINDCYNPMIQSKIFNSVFLK